MRESTQRGLLHSPEQEAKRPEAVITITMQYLLTVLGLLNTPFYMKKSLETLSVLGNFSLNVGGTEATMVLSFSNHLTQEAMGHTGLTHVEEGDAKRGFAMYIPRDLLLV